VQTDSTGWHRHWYWYLPRDIATYCIAISGVKSLKRFAMSQIGRLTPHYQHGNCRTPGRSVMHKANQPNQALHSSAARVIWYWERGEEKCVTSKQPLTPASRFMATWVFPGLVYRFWQPHCIRISRITSLWCRSPSRHSVALASLIVASR
jgi:hypothetical protein